jgi:adenosylcobinamide-GDP ribazoletransferase
MIRRELAAFFAALGYFTRLPVPAWVGYSADGLARAARYLPAIGLIVGGAGALVFWLAMHVWAQPVAVALAMVATIALTGAFHEDGLSDTADGLGGGWDKAKILAIMKDSRVGSYGVIAIVLALLGKFALLATLPAGQVVAALIAGHAVSRFCAVSLMATMDYARDDETSKARPLAARLGTGALLFALVFAGLPLLLLSPEQVVTAVALAALATLWLAAKCRRWLGGYTGDCLGAVQQVAEIAFYLGLAARIY